MARLGSSRSPSLGRRYRDDRSKDASSRPSQADDAQKKQAERLAKIEAWKKKIEKQGQKDKESDANPGQTRNLLAEMDQKVDKSQAAASQSSSIAPGAPVPAYAGKFDYRAVAKKSAASRTPGPGGRGILGTFGPKEAAAGGAPTPRAPVASALPPQHNTSSFGFHKFTKAGKISKHRITFEEEPTPKRPRTKMPTIALEPTDAPYADQDDDDLDGQVLANTEEEAAAAARAAHERRMQLHQAAQAAEAPSTASDTDQPAPPNGTTYTATSAPGADAMDIDDEEVDPLDAYMKELEEKEAANDRPSRRPEARGDPYFSDDNFFAQGDKPKAGAAATKTKKIKDIPAVDYSKMELVPVRKDFWVEPAELRNLTEAEATDLRLELDGIKVSGKDVPNPVQKWAQCGLTRQTLDVIEGLGFEKPTPIQMQALPAIMSGRDVVGMAKTGSGKTIAFLLPMFRHIKDQAPLKENEGPIGLIMTPTRELAAQIHRDCKAFLKTMNLRAVCAYGGAPIRDQIAELRRGAEIMIGTPGRLIELLAANHGRVTNLTRVTYVVLDEADRMFDMGFEPQVLKIFARMRPDKQTILFSATMPRIMESLAKKVLKNPVEITVGGKSVVAPEITQIVEVREEKAKFLRLLELLGELYDKDEDARTLVFVERQEKADDLLMELMVKGYPCNSLHGGKDQVDRDSTIADFKKGIFPVLIATSVAARGLDVKQLKLVVNYDAPNHLEDYVHRAGRTGRAGNKGTAVTFVTEEQEHCAAGIAKALEQSGNPVPEKLKEMRAAHREKVKAGKAKESSGFGGKGLDKLDAEREAARLRERKAHRAEGEEEDFKDEDKQADDEKAQKATSQIRAAASAIVSREAARAAASDEPKKPEVKEAAPAASSAAAAGDALESVKNAASKINFRLGKSGQLRSGQPIDNKGPDAGAFHATLEINDFPQKARWAVTNRTNVAKILESTGTSITTKGTFYAAGKEPQPGQDPKLYILVEGDTELVVASALQELERLLEEGTRAAEETASRAPVSGRYTVT